MATRYFNPRTREGCDLLGMLKEKELPEISIHAPVKGATTPLGEAYLIPFIFQSTHP